MLVQFVLIVFALFGIMSMVIDMGSVRLTQIQMQNAADTASIEGLRFRNINLEDGFAADCTRRIAAREIVRRTFADDIDPVTNQPRVLTGAGPIIAFDDDGVGDLNARQDITHQFAMYKPVLQLNGPATTGGGNFEYGDMVSGRFQYGDVVGGVFTARSSLEEPSYHRPGQDFTPDPPPPPEAPYGGCPSELPLTNLPDPPTSGPMLDAEAHKAFLVRLRRTNDFGGLDNVAAVSTAGPTLPLLFGRGTTIEAPQEGQLYSVRRDGITVRATSIANARPALRVGLPTAGMNGATPFVVDRAFYLSLNNGDPSGPPPVTAHLDAATGQILDGSGSVVGLVVAEPDRVSIAVVGSRLPAPSMSVACDPSKTPEENTIGGFGPVSTSIGPSAMPRVIGFGRVEMVWPDCAGNPTAVQFFRHAQVVAVGNATAIAPGGLPANLPRADISELLTANRDLAAPASGGLLAAVLAR